MNKAQENNNNVKVCVDRNFSNTEDIVRSAVRSRSENIRNVPIAHIPHILGALPQDDPLSMAILTGRMWQNGRTLKVRFLNGHPEIQSKVRSIAKQWENYANIKLLFVDDGESEIRIAFKWNGDTGSWSFIGTDALSINPSEPTMNFGWLELNTPIEEYNRVVLHEWGHGLGCVHEHNNPSANIPWNKPVVYDYYKGPPNFWTKEEIDNNLFGKYDASYTNFTEFDEDSIMIYAIPNAHTLGDFEVKSNKELSQKDKEFIKANYPFESKPLIEIAVNSQAIEAEIGDHGEEDMYKFMANQQGQYTIETQGPTDVVMVLLGPNNQTNLIAQDDDSGVSRNAKIIANLQPGEYFIRVKHYHATGTGNYKLAIAM